MESSEVGNIEPQEETPEWYSAKCIFRHNNLTGNKKTTAYEERVVILRAHNFDEAMSLGEEEAKAYANSLDGVEYLNFISVFHLFAKRMRSKTEVYSLMRKNKLSEKQFLDRYYDDGTECAESA
jgi:hypothetical protein